MKFSDALKFKMANNKKIKRDNEFVRLYIIPSDTNLLDYIKGFNQSKQLIDRAKDFNVYGIWGEVTNLKYELLA